LCKSQRQETETKTENKGNSSGMTAATNHQYSERIKWIYFLKQT